MKLEGRAATSGNNEDKSHMLRMEEKEARRSVGLEDSLKHVQQYSTLLVVCIKALFSNAVVVRLLLHAQKLNPN